MVRLTIPGRNSNRDSNFEMYRLLNRFTQSAGKKVGGVPVFCVVALKRHLDWEKND